MTSAPPQGGPGSAAADPPQWELVDERWGRAAVGFGRPVAEAST